MKKKYEAPQIVVVATMTENLLNNTSYIPVSDGTVRPKAPLNNLYEGTGWVKSTTDESLSWDDDEEDY